MRKYLSAAAAVAVMLSSLPMASAMQMEMSSDVTIKSGSMTRGTVRATRMSRRMITSQSRQASAKIRDKCKDLIGAERGMCLNPTLKSKKVKKDMHMEAKSFWYKLDGSAMLWWKNGETWERSKTGLWQDAKGNWLKVGEGKLWWSADAGKTWSEVPEWMWMGTDSKWYKFDASWKLWWSTDNGTTWSAVETATWPGM